VRASLPGTPSAGAGRRARLVAAAAVALLFGAPAAAGAQEVVVTGLPEPAATHLARILADDAFTLIDRDTVLGESFLAYGDLLIVDAEVRLEGEVRGDAVVVGGALFLRPGAVVQGSILVVGGLFLHSTLASYGEVTEVPGEITALRGDVDRGFVVTFLEAPPEPPLQRLVLPGFFGVGLPVYQRVDALTLNWGIQWRPGGDLQGPVVGARVAYRTARRSFGGGLEADLPLGRGNRLSLLAERATRTPDLWIRGDLVNSLLHAARGSDPRNYHESDRVRLAVERPLPFLTFRGWGHGPFLRLELSRDRSLEAVDTWSLLGREPRRRNPPVFEGRLASVTAGSQLRWSGATSRVDGVVMVERGLEVAGIGEWEFTQWTADGSVRMEALWGHTITSRARAMGTLGGVEAPRQRWSHVGGGGTLPTVGEAALDGDNLLFVDTRYLAPLTPLGFTALGPPQLELAHLAGTAWPTGARPTLEQALGVGMRLLLASAMIYVDPREGWRSRIFTLEASLPGGF
jgi:hypothetical protein